MTWSLRFFVFLSRITIFLIPFFYFKIVDLKSAMISIKWKCAAYMFIVLFS
jgi:hypothetical protein